MRPIKVCLVSHSSFKFGAERALLELLDALRELGVDCNVILPAEGPLSEDLKKREITYCTLPYNWWAGPATTVWRRTKRILGDVFVAIRMAQILYRWKCDVVISNSIVIGVGAFSARLLNLPHIWFIHELGIKEFGFGFYFGEKVSLGLIDRLSEVCIANSRTVCQEFQKFITPSKLKVIYQSVNVSQGSVENLPKEHNSPTRCIIVGRLEERKGQQDAIRAISDLVGQGVRIELIILGDGEDYYKEFLYNLVREHKLENQVKFIGYVENAFSFIQDADILLNCSGIESFGRVTIEAMKAGKPVIGVRSGANSELIREGFNGLLYPPMDNKELAEKIRYLTEHPRKAQQMGDNGRQWALERFSQNRYGEEVLTILKSLIT